MSKEVKLSKDTFLECGRWNMRIRGDSTLVYLWKVEGTKKTAITLSPDDITDLQNILNVYYELKDVSNE